MTALLALCAAFCFGLAIALTPFGLRHTAPIQGASISIPTSTVFFLAISPITIDFAEWHGPSALIFALVGVLYPAMVTLMLFLANRRLGPNVAGALGNATPLFATVIAVILLGEAPRPIQIAAMLVIVAGVVMLYRLPNHIGNLRWFILLPLLGALIRGLV